MELDLTDLTTFLENSSHTNPESIDFDWNLIEFHFNVTFQKNGKLGILQSLDFYSSKMNVLLGGQSTTTDPSTLFKSQFISNYKLAEHASFEQETEKNVKEDEELKQADDDELIEVIDQDEDKVAKKDPNFKLWRNGLAAQINCMRILLKVVDFMDSADEMDEDDEEFEDCDDDQGGDDDGMEDDGQAVVIDLD